YDDYFKRIRGMIKKQWAYPCVKHSFRPCEYLDADLVLEFGILKDGRVPYVIVEKPFLYAVYNEYAVRRFEQLHPSRRFRKFCSVREKVCRYVPPFATSSFSRTDISRAPPRMGVVG